MSLQDYGDIFLVAFSYAEFVPQHLFEHYLRMTDARMCYKLLQNDIRIRVKVEDINTMLKAKMFDCVKLFLTREPFDFDLSSCCSTLDYNINELLQTISTTPNLQWFISLVKSPVLQQLIQITLKQFSLIENLDVHRLVVNLFFAKAPFELVIEKLQSLHSHLFWHAMIGCLRRNQESEIKASIEFLETKTTFLDDENILKNILSILLNEHLLRPNVVKWLIQDRKISPQSNIARVALYGNKDLFCDAQHLCDAHILVQYQEDCFLKAIQSKNWDFVRFLSKQYGAKIIQTTLWYPLSCGFVDWLQICWDENLADFSVIEDHSIYHLETLHFLQRLMPAFLPVEKCLVNKKRKL